MADPSPSRDGLAQIADQINAVWRAIAELKAPSGTQQANAVAKLEEAVAELQRVILTVTAQQVVIVDLVDGIQQTLTDFIASDLAAIVNDAVNAKLASSDITIGTANGVVRIPSIFNTDVVATLRPRVAVWANDLGVVGHT